MEASIALNSSGNAEAMIYLLSKRFRFSSLLMKLSYFDFPLKINFKIVVLRMNPTSMHITETMIAIMKTPLPL
jgi:hypothetical protein